MLTASRCSVAAPADRPAPGCHCTQFCDHAELCLDEQIAVIMSGRRSVIHDEEYKSGVISGLVSVHSYGLNDQVESPPAVGRACVPQPCSAYVWLFQVCPTPSAVSVVDPCHTGYTSGKQQPAGTHVQDNKRDSLCPRTLRRTCHSICGHRVWRSFTTSSFFCGH